MCRQSKAGRGEPPPHTHTHCRGPSHLPPRAHPAALTWKLETPRFLKKRDGNHSRNDPDSGTGPQARLGQRGLPRAWPPGVGPAAGRLRLRAQGRWSSCRLSVTGRAVERVTLPLVTTGILAAWCIKATSGPNQGRVSTGTLQRHCGRRPALPLWSYQRPSLLASVSPSVKQWRWPGWPQAEASTWPCSCFRSWGPKTRAVAPTVQGDRFSVLAPGRMLGVDPRGCLSGGV